jgi:tetratricopeptide (TPR) repeat protein
MAKQQPLSGITIGQTQRMLGQAKRAYQTGDLTQAFTLGRNAVATAALAKDPTLMIETSLFLSDAARQAGKTRFALGQTLKAKEIVQAGAPVALQIDVLQSESFLRFLSFQLEVARSLAQQALDMAQTHSELHRIANARTALALTREAEGEDNSARADYEEATQDARDSGNMLRYITAESDHARLLAARGDYRLALDHLAVSQARAQEHEWVKDQIINTTRRTDILRQREDLSTKSLLDLYAENLARAQRSGFVSAEAELLDRLGIVKFQQGETSEAITYFADAAQRWELFGYKVFAPIARYHLAEAYHSQGAIDQAVAQYLAILQLAKKEYALTGAFLDPALQQLVAVLSEYQPAKVSSTLKELARLLHESLAPRFVGPLALKRSRRELLVALPAVIDRLQEQTSRWLTIGKSRVDTTTGEVLRGSRSRPRLTEMPLRALVRLDAEVDPQRYVSKRELYAAALNVKLENIAHLKDEVFDEPVRQYIAAIRRSLGHTAIASERRKQKATSPDGKRAGGYRLRR